MTTVNITGSVANVVGADAAGVVLTVTPVLGGWTNGSKLILGEEFPVTADGAGAVDFDVEPGAYQVAFQLARGVKTVGMLVDGTGDQDLAEVINSTNSQALTTILQQALAAQTAAEAARNLAQEWAENPEDTAITGTPTGRSALHYAAKAADRAADAASVAANGRATGDTPFAFVVARTGAPADMTGYTEDDVYDDATLGKSILIAGTADPQYLAPRERVAVTDGRVYELRVTARCKTDSTGANALSVLVWGWEADGTTRVYAQTAHAAEALTVADGTLSVVKTFSRDVAGVNHTITGDPVLIRPNITITDDTDDGEWLVSECSFIDVTERYLAEAAQTGAEAAEAAAEAWSQMPYANRAAAEAASKVSGQRRFDILSPNGEILRYREDAVASSPALVMADGTKLVPAGKYTPDHYAENTTPGTTNMLAAIHAAAANSTFVSLLNQSYFISDSVRLTTSNSRLRGTGRNSGCYIAIDPTTTVPAVIVGKTNPAVDGRVTGVELRGITFSGGSNAARTRHAVEVLRGERVNIRDCRSIGFLSGIAIYGGQFNSIRGWHHTGVAGTNVAGTSCFKQDVYDLGGGSYEDAFTSNLTDFFMSAGGSNATAYIFEINNADSLNIAQGYVARAGTALIKLGPTTDGVIAALHFTNVYFDGVTTSGGAPLGLEIPSGVSAGKISASFTSCFLGQIDGDILSVSNDDLGRLAFSNCIFANASGDLGTLTSTTSSEGIVSFDGCQFSNAGPLTLSTMRSAHVAGCDFWNISGANPLVFSGTIPDKTYSDIRFTGTSGAMLDSATGSDATPVEYWYSEPAFTPTVTIGGSSTGITYSTQTAVIRKIGKIVFLSLRITLSSKGGLTGDVKVPLPFAAAAVEPMAALVQSGTATLGSVHIAMQTQGSGSSVALLRKMNASGSNVAITDADISDTATITVSGVYTRT